MSRRVTLKTNLVAVAHKQKYPQLYNLHSETRATHPIRLCKTRAGNSTCTLRAKTRVTQTCSILRKRDKCFDFASRVLRMKNPHQPRPRRPPAAAQNTRHTPTHTHTHANTQTYEHTRARTRTHTHTHTHPGLARTDATNLELPNARADYGNRTESLKPMTETTAFWGILGWPYKWQVRSGD